jgi:hypothetical protein
VWRPAAILTAVAGIRSHGRCRVGGLHRGPRNICLWNRL